MAAELVRIEMLERWRNGSRLARLADAGWLVLAGVYVFVFACLALLYALARRSDGA
jgi:hypothetical protein